MTEPWKDEDEEEFENPLEGFEGLLGGLGKFMEDFQKNMEDELASINISIMTMPTVRPTHGDTQVMTLEDFKVGQWYRMHYKETDKMSHIDAYLVMKRTKYFWFFTEDTMDATSGPLRCYYNDQGLAPYEGEGLEGDDVWHHSNWIELRPNE